MFKVNHDYNNIELQNNTLKLFVYYKNLKYSEIKQIPKTQFSDLVSQIGGTLGLFIGFKLLSCIEILQFLLEIVFIFFKKLTSFNKR